jgi:hypothetical protein
MSKYKKNKAHTRDRTGDLVHSFLPRKTPKGQIIPLDHVGSVQPIGLACIEDKTVLEIALA